MNGASLVLAASDVGAIVQRVGRDALMDALIARLADAINALNPRHVQVPPRSGVAYHTPEWGLLEWMPAHFGMKGTTVKIVGYHPTNPDCRGMPTVISTICLFDS